MTDHIKFMQMALQEAEEAGMRGDLPIGAVIVHQDKVIARSSSRVMTAESRVHHAENSAIFQCAPYLKRYAKECTIYTTVEPCIMCLTTIVMAKIPSIVYAIRDMHMDMEPFIESNPNIKDRIKSNIGGVLEEDAVQLFRMYAPGEMEKMSKHNT